MKDREFRLTDLFLELILHWRVILIWMLAGAVCAGAFGYVWSYRSIKTQGTELKKEQLGTKESEYREMLEDGLTDRQLHNVNYVVAYEKIYADCLAYQEHSILMQIDPNKVQQAELTFYISSNDRLKSSDIEKVYEDIVQGNELCEYITARIDGENANINEIISLNRGSSDLLEGVNTFQLLIVHYDEKICKNIAEAVIDFLNAKQKEIMNDMGKHNIVVISQSFTTASDMKILTQQKNNLLDNVAMEDVIIQRKDTFTDAEKQYYEFLTDLSENGDETIQENKKVSAEQEGLSRSVNIKYIILGIILAAFAYVFIFTVMFVLDTKIRARDSLQELYGIAQLGTIPQQEARRKPFHFIDHWIMSLRDRGRRSFSKAEALQLSAVAVKIAAAKEEAAVVCLIGCDLKEQSMEVCEAVSRELAYENVQTEILNNVLYDVQAMSGLEHAQCAVLVERAGSTMYSEIVKELELLKRQGISVLGGIVVE